MQPLNARMGPIQELKRLNAAAQRMNEAHSGIEDAYNLQLLKLSRWIVENIW